MDSKFGETVIAPKRSHVILKHDENAYVELYRNNSYVCAEDTNVLMHVQNESYKYHLERFTNVCRKSDHYLVIWPLTELFSALVLKTANFVDFLGGKIYHSSIIFDWSLPKSHKP